MTAPARGDDGAVIRRSLDGVVPEALPDVFDDTMTVERLASRAAVDGHLLVIAVADDRTVGQCTIIIQHLAHKAADLHVENLGVAAAHRRRGIATALPEEALAWGGELGCDEAWIATEVDNDAANRLYESVGSAVDPALIHVIPITQPT